MYVLKTASMKGYGIAHRRPFFGSHSIPPFLLLKSSSVMVTVHATFVPDLSSERFQSWKICGDHGTLIPLLQIENMAETTKSVNPTGQVRQPNRATGRHSGPSLSRTVFLWSQETTISQSWFSIHDSHRGFIQIARNNNIEIEEEQKKRSKCGSAAAKFLWLQGSQGAHPPPAKPPREAQ